MPGKASLSNDVNPLDQVMEEENESEDIAPQQ